MALKKDYSHLKEGYYSNAYIRKNLPKLVKTANQRLTELKRHGIEFSRYSGASTYLDVKGREKFSGALKGKSDIDIRKEFNQVVKFLNAKTSTVSGYREIAQYQKEAFEKKLKEEGINVTDEELDKLHDFLQSKEFESLRKYIDSDQVIEDFAQSLIEGAAESEIMEGYRKFLEDDSEMTFEQIRERRLAAQGKEITYI